MALSTVQLTLNGQTYDLTDQGNGTWSATVTAPNVTSWNAESDHKYHGVVVATDAAGNTDTATVSEFSTLALRVLEVTAPLIKPVSPTTGAFVTNNAPTIIWEVTDAGSGIDASTIKLTIDTTEYISGITTETIDGGYRCTFTVPSALSDGDHTISYAVSDNDGNSAAATSIVITVDTVPPTLTVTAPAEGLITNNSQVTVTGVTNDAGSSPVTVTVNGQAVEVGDDGSFSTTVTLSDEGSNKITIIATDSAGQTTTIERTVVLDTTPPVISAISITPNPVNVGNTYTITVTVTDS